MPSLSGVLEDDSGKRERGGLDAGDEYRPDCSCLRKVAHMQLLSYRDGCPLSFSAEQFGVVGVVGPGDEKLQLPTAGHNHER